MNRLFLVIVAIGVPLSVIGSFLHFPQAVMFAVYCIAIIGLASFMGRATESLAIIAGPRIGGLLNATFGNAVELIISFFALKQGLTAIVLASLTGSVIGNLLLVAGLSFFVGGLKYKRQEFNVHDARHNSGLLMFAIIVAFVIPEVFSIGMAEDRQFVLSIGISIVMILLYVAALYFKLVSHRGVYVAKQEMRKGKQRRKKKHQNGLGSLPRRFYSLRQLLWRIFQSGSSIHLTQSENSLAGVNCLSGSSLLRLSVMQQNTHLLSLWRIKTKWMSRSKLLSVLRFKSP